MRSITSGSWSLQLPEHPARKHIKNGLLLAYMRASLRRVVHDMIISRHHDVPQLVLLSWLHRRM
jgi:hypothetical protein